MLSRAPFDNTKTIFNAPERVSEPEQSSVETYVIALLDEYNAAQVSNLHTFLGDTELSTCETAIRLLVWTKDCTDGGENTYIKKILRRIDSKTLTSTDLLC